MTMAALITESNKNMDELTNGDKAFVETLDRKIKFLEDSEEGSKREMDIMHLQTNRQLYIQLAKVRYMMGDMNTNFTDYKRRFPSLTWLFYYRPVETFCYAFAGGIAGVNLFISDLRDILLEQVGINPTIFTDINKWSLPAFVLLMITGFLSGRANVGRLKKEK